MTREAGYTTRILTANAPTPTLPECYHEHDLQQRAYPQGLTYEYAFSRYKQFLPPSSPTYQPGPDQPRPTGRPEAFVRSSQEMYHDEWIPRGSADLTTEDDEVENSPVYESDPDGLSSEGHGLPSPRSPSHRQQDQSQSGSPERQGTSNTVVSQPISGGTVVETEEHQQTTAVSRPTSLGDAIFIQVPRPKSRTRRHSDTPFKNGGFVFPSGRLHASEDSHYSVPERIQTSEKRTHRLPESSSPVIHPYVRYFLSRLRFANFY